MAVNLSPIWGAGAQLLDNSGNVLSGGKIYTYAAGTTTQVATYTSNSGNTANSNPIILNSAGRVPYEIWLTDGQNYKFVLKDSNDVLIGTWDNLNGINSNFVNYTNEQEIQTATAGQTVFNLTTMNYLPGTGNLSVFVDGVNQYGPGAQYAYEETDSSTVTFASGLHVGASVKFTSTQIQNAGVTEASQIEYQYPATGSFAQSVQNRLQQNVFVSDFQNDLAAAITGIGSANAVLIVTDEITVSDDIIVPENIVLQIGNNGLITIDSGKRLYVNGGFQSDRKHQCFNAELITNTITASISGNALTVSSVSSDTIAPGQILTGTGVGVGQYISQTFGETGVAVYTLNDYNGILTSRTMTLTGASVIFATGTVEEVYPQWFGAVGDGVADDTEALQHAVYSVIWGGKVKIPAGKYKVTDNIVLHPSIIVEGDCTGNPYAGQPSPGEFNAVTYIYMATDNKFIFVIPGRCNHVNISKITFATDVTPYMSGGDFAPYGTGRKAIVYNGHYPQYIFGGTITDCYFFGFDQAILANDSWAGTGDGVGAAGTYWNGTASVTYYDWAINPIQVQNCNFVACTYGIVFNTNNADDWRILDSVFYIPTNGQGVRLTRCGYFKMDSCFATGANTTSTNFVELVGTGAEALDSITLDNCQAENCAHFLNFGTGSTSNTPPAINVRNCKYELGSDVYLGSPCEYNSQNNVILAQTYIDSANVRVNSINDHFWYINYVSNPTYGITVVSGDSNTIYTYIQGKYPSSTLNGPIFNGAPYYTLSSSGSPSGVITPLRIGETYFDGAAVKFYMSTGLTNTSWVAIN